MVAVTLSSSTMTDRAAATPAAPGGQQISDADSETGATGAAAGLMLAALLSLPIWGLIYALVRLAVP